MKKEKDATGVLLLGPDSPLLQSIAEGLKRAGHMVRFPQESESARADEYPSCAVIVPWRTSHAAVQDVDVDAFASGLEAMLADASGNLRMSGLHPAEARLSRLVVLSGWEVHGGRCRTSMAAVSGAMLGLARSWALEFRELGMTVNAVIPGPDFTVHGREALSLTEAEVDDLIYAIEFFLDERARSISGQVLAVCAGRSPATISV
jgi:NAD(P)-dependent dehydrogenase (short-subunit alcohol dehydrogenase family)